MENYKNVIPDGVEDIQWKEYEHKEEMEEKLKRVFKSFGYKQVVPPSFEYYDMFSDGDGTIEKDEMLKFIDSTGKVLVLRPDPTAPVARMAANSTEKSEKFQKYFYSVNVFRNSIINMGKKREFLQAGVEYLGNSSSECDGEVIATAIKSMLSCELDDICIDMGHAGFFKGLMQECGISPEEENRIRNYVEDKNVAGLKKLLEELGVSKELKVIIEKLPVLYGKPEEVLAKAESLALNQPMSDAVKDLRNIYLVLDDYGYKDYIQLDLGFINHLNYYTGAIFMGYVRKHGSELLRGGRYDNLTGQYGCLIPATGFGINVDEVIEVIKEREGYKNKESRIDYMLVYSPDTRRDVLRLSLELRSMGYIVETCTASDNIKEALDKIGSIPGEVVKPDGKLLHVWNASENCSFTCTSEVLLKRAAASGEMMSIH